MESYKGVCSRVRTNADKTNDYPFDQITKSVMDQLQENPRLRFFQKFTCEKCGNRLMMSEPNKFYRAGDCDKCHHVTDIEKRGCNYMMLMTADNEHGKIFDDLIRRLNEEDK